MPAGENGVSASLLKIELEAKINWLEKENLELKQEVIRLKAQINTLKAHDLERKTILWKKLQNTMDCGKHMDDPPQKHKLQIEVPMKKTSSNNAPLPKASSSPPQWLQRQVTAPPPPPPPLPRTPVSSKAVRRVPEVMEFYRTLMKRDTLRENKSCATGLVGATYSRDMIGEIEKRSTYLTSIKPDVLKYGEVLKFLIREVEIAAFMEIAEVEAFVTWVDGELSCLVDERAVLKHFPQWPERKADALREAACSYRDLKNLESQVLAFKSCPNSKQPVVEWLRKMRALEDRLESSISGLERTREATSKRYKELQIPWQWLMDTGVVGEVKLSSLKLARECMTRISKESGDLLVEGVGFAFRVHQFAGGFDTETMHAFQELKRIRG